MRRSCIPGIALLFLSGLTVADEPKSGFAAPRIEEPAMDVVLVTGEQPGPAFWKVTSGDHVLWILGEVSPVPRKMKWRSKQFERRLAQSQEVLLETGQVSQACMQLHAAMPRLSDPFAGRTLKDVLSPEHYSRVQAVSDIYGEREKIEKLHPFAATTHLWNRVPYSLKLRIFGASVAANDLARKADVRVTWIPLPCMTQVDAIHPSEFPVPCVERVLEVIEDGGSGLRRLANAWSIGDIKELRHLVPAYAVANESHQPSKCTVALTGEQFADELVARRTESWLNVAERALRENRNTMAVVPIAELFAPDGYLAGLRAKEFEVNEPAY
ncbi:MAG TPA: TraB/GumN family protein [Steroidobacteraceae bacterium]|nr:TraB/GumN family protein [Steroidobacteraceae bacterium]